MSSKAESLEVLLVSVTVCGVRTVVVVTVAVDVVSVTVTVAESNLS